MEKSVRTAYKKLIKLAQSLPVDQKPVALDKVRVEFRSHGPITTADALDKIVMKAQSKISYLKIVTPKRAPQTGPQRYIYKDWKRLDPSGIDESGNATIKTVDVNAMMERHVKLIRRQHFMDRK